MSCMLELTNGNSRPVGALRIKEDGTVDGWETDEQTAAGWLGIFQKDAWQSVVVLWARLSADEKAPLSRLSHKPRRRWGLLHVEAARGAMCRPARVAVPGRIRRRARPVPGARA